MASRKNDPADPAGLPALILAVQPFVGHSVVTVSLSVRAGAHRFDSRLARWHLRLTRADLAGHSTDDVILTVLGMVVQRLKQQRSDPADWQQSNPVSDTAVGTGAPASGATGAVQDSLPGLGADSPALGGLDLV